MSKVSRKTIRNGQPAPADGVDRPIGKGVVSIKEIARLAGVSIGTVDRVVHQRGRVAPQTAERVRDVIAATGYRPNMFASQLSRGRIYRFGVLMPEPSQDSEFWRLPWRGIEKAATELRTHHVEVIPFFFDKYCREHSVFAEHFHRILADPPDGLLISPVFPEWMRPLLGRLPAECPYVFFDSNLPGTTPIAAIVQDSFQSGVLAARLTDLLIGGRGRVALLQVAPTDFHLLERARGFLDYFSTRPDVRCDLHDVEGDRLDESFRTAMRRALAGRAQVKCVFVTNALTFRAAEYLVEHPTVQRPGVIGYDLIPANIRQVEAGMIDFLIDPRPELQGYLGLYTLYRRVVLHEVVPPLVPMPIDIVTRENLAYAAAAGSSESRGH